MPHTQAHLTAPFNLWESRFIFPWIHIDSLHYYCSHCFLSQKKHLFDHPEEFERFIKGHTHCAPEIKSTPT
jgi:hypothetical protein